MSGQLSPAEVRQRSVSTMPDRLGELHYALHDEVAWLHLKWKDFRALYASSRETIDLLNASAPIFFSNLQRTLSEDVLLHLCRLTDPPRSAGKDTLSIRRLPQLIPDTDLQREVQCLADAADLKTRFARDWRNRRLAHQELPPLDGQAPATPPQASYQQIEDALAAIRQIMNRVEFHYQGGSVSYEHAIEGLGGVASLLARLRRGVHPHRSVKRGRGFQDDESDR